MLNVFKKTISCILALSLLICYMPMNAEAYVNHSQEEAVNWIANAGNIGWAEDVDNYADVQCVDLVKAYYNYMIRESNETFSA